MTRHGEPIGGPTSGNAGFVQGTPYVNLGTAKACMFVPLSRFLLNRVRQYPLMPVVVEEGMVCAGMGYYVAGIMCLSQVLNMLKEEAPGSRHGVAHSLLQQPPSRQAYEAVRADVQEAAEAWQEREIAKAASPQDWGRKVFGDWSELLWQQHGVRITLRADEAIPGPGNPEE